jgi:hypothetical protein
MFTVTTSISFLLQEIGENRRNYFCGHKTMEYHQTNTEYQNHATLTYRRIVLLSPCFECSMMHHPHMPIIYLQLRNHAFAQH